MKVKVTCERIDKGEHSGTLQMIGEDIRLHFYNIGGKNPGIGYGYKDEYSILYQKRDDKWEVNYLKAFEGKDYEYLREDEEHRSQVLKLFLMYEPIMKMHYEEAMAQEEVQA